MQYIIILVILFVVELLYFKIADKFNIIDKPNERSSHSTITLRGGGIIFYFGALAFFFYSDFQYPYFFLGLTAISIISFLDDIFTLSNKIRLLIHLSSVLLMFYEIDLFIFPIWVIPIAVVVAIGTINAYNFMDGINGITVSYSTAVLLLLAYVNTQYPFIDPEFIYYVLLSCIVFGFFNFRQKAKCFAGDVGSVAIAFIVLFLIAKAMVTTGSLFYLLFLAVYGIDAVWTILRRLSKKENIFKAHRSHLYQYLANENKTNKLVVSSVYGLLQLIVGGIVIWAASKSMQVQIIVAIAVLLVGSGLYLTIKQNMIKKHNL
ncbi:glycosyltransferase family 4 protein [Flavobacterium sp. xlx-214]|uniref:MraY family glycosyltransferase n=1 Tax=unclassified Flavobacterium TaxID=196869 RepID=UPI0013D62F47|nr:MULTISPECIES: glycosyltransferase family 4 protein [unclassified Flavobacterium]MBA5794023.1 glycosyltransferase family 4 protein [Flavobacterium sp. xlx-221]QMI83162.1 glycosyltransferase family 4 protein [Flavobacterium sp. xlx-214]